MTSLGRSVPVAAHPASATLPWATRGAQLPDGEMHVRHSLPSGARPPGAGPSLGGGGCRQWPGEGSGRGTEPAALPGGRAPPLLAAGSWGDGLLSTSVCHIRSWGVRGASRSPDCDGASRGRRCGRAAWPRPARPRCLVEAPFHAEPGCAAAPCPPGASRGAEGSALPPPRPSPPRLPADVTPTVAVA